MVHRTLLFTIFLQPRMSTWKALRETYQGETNKASNTKFGMDAVHHRKWSLYYAIRFPKPVV